LRRAKDGVRASDPPGECASIAAPRLASAGTTVAIVPVGTSSRSRIAGSHTTMRSNPRYVEPTTTRGGIELFKKLLAVVALVSAVLVLFHVHIGDLDGLRILAIGLGALAVAALS
jgi:hypothetical protein